MGGKVGKKAECRCFETGTRMLLAILSLSHARVCVCVRVLVDTVSNLSRGVAQCSGLQIAGDGGL